MSLLPTDTPQATFTAPDTMPVVAEGYRSVLSNRNFLALWIAQVFSQLADRIIFVVFIALILKYFGPADNDRHNSYLYVAFTIPAILLTAVAGVFVDRWPRRRTLVVTNLLRAAFVACIPMVTASAPWLIYVMAFLVSSATQFFVPAEAATIPMIVRRTQLFTANSLFTTTLMASVIFGFALGDPLINIFRLENVHWALSGLFILSSIALMFMHVPKTEPSLTNKAPVNLAGIFSDFFDEIRIGFDYIFEHKTVLNCMLKLAVFFSVMIAMCILFVNFAKVYLYDDPQVASRKFAYIVTFSGIGMAFGAFLVGKQFRGAKRGFLVFNGFITIGACLCLLAATGRFDKAGYLFHTPAVVHSLFYLDPVHLTNRMAYTYVLSALMGIAGAMIAIPLQSTLHELIDEDKRGKVLGILFTILSTSSTIPVLIIGEALNWTSLSVILLLMGVPLLTFGFIGLVGRMKNRHVTTPDW